MAKNSKLATFSGQLAIFILKVASSEALIYKGLRANWPFGHIFFYFHVRKNIYIINKEKGGHLANLVFYIQNSKRSI